VILLALLARYRARLSRWSSRGQSAPGGDIRSVDTCQAFSVVRIGSQPGVIAKRLSALVRTEGKSFAPVAPKTACATVCFSGAAGRLSGRLSPGQIRCRGPRMDAGSRSCCCQRCC